MKLESEADYDEAVWCKIVCGKSKLTIGLVYRNPNINEEDNIKTQNAIKEVSKRECIIMGDFNHGRTHTMEISVVVRINNLYF